jgi:tetratricopeptide (TPR) repeat protein
MGECFLLTNRTKQAAAAFRKAHQAEPNRGLLGYNLARIAKSSGKPKKALSHLQAYFDEKQSTSGFAPYELLAEILEELGKEEEVTTRLEETQARDPDNVPLTYFLAGRFLDAEDYAKAEALYRSVIDEDQTSTGYRKLLEVYCRADRPEQVLDMLAKASAKTSSLEPLGEEILAILNKKESVDKLAELARKQIETDPEGFDFFHRLAIALLAMNAKMYEVASEFHRLAIDADPDRQSELLLGWGLGLFAAEQYSQAAEVFQLGIEAEVPPGDKPVFHYYQSVALEMDGRTEEALVAARRAADIRDEARFLNRVAWMLYRSKQNDQAQKAYQELIDRFDSQHDSQEVREVLRESRLALSNIHARKGENEEAVEYLEQVLDEFPDNISALNDLGYLWADQNQHLQRAYRMVQKAVEGDPESAAYRDSLGWVLYRLGRIDEAVPELEKAASGEPDPIILDHLGDAYQAAGRLDKAKEAWNRAAEAFLEQDEEQEASKVIKKIDARDNDASEEGKPKTG